MIKLNNSIIMNHLLERVSSMGSSQAFNIIAFSGGVDSSVVAGAVFKIFPKNTKCVIGMSKALPSAQLHLARSVVDFIGVPLEEVKTTEGQSEQYVKNEGMSCYSCKTHLYTALNDIDHYMKDIDKLNDVVLFNGTNKDDLKDKTRVGLLAANEFRVASPLDDLTKNEVRAIALELGLPNHAYAASPCLRSRLAYGVKATDENLNRIEEAEILVRQILNPSVEQNIRVRHMEDGGAQIELDRDFLESSRISSLLPFLSESIGVLGFTYIRFNPFKSGSVAKLL